MYNNHDLINETVNLFKDKNLALPEMKVNNGIIVYSRLPFKSNYGRDLNLCLKLIPNLKKSRKSKKKLF